MTKVKETVGGAVMVADPIYDQVKSFCKSNGHNIGWFFAEAAKDRMGTIMSPVELKAQIQPLIEEARKYIVTE